jgi:hypothetical protein
MKPPTILKELKSLIIGEEQLDLSEVEYFQANLKDITQEDVQKLGELMLNEGILDPVKVWKREDGKCFMLDGHARKLAYEWLKKQGHKIPPYPCLILKCRNEQHAAEIVLALRTSYGQMNEDGLYEFLHLKNIKDKFYSTLRQRLSYPTIDLKRFYENYFLESRPVHPAFSPEDFAKTETENTSETLQKQVAQTFDEFETIPLAIVITRTEKRIHDELKKQFGVKSDTEVYRKLVSHYRQTP